MSNGWKTLYEITGSGPGFGLWVALLLWIGGICAGSIWIRQVPFQRWFLCLWLAGWTFLGWMGIGNAFLQYELDCRALREQRCAIVEGVVAEFHSEITRKTGHVYESFVVNGRQFNFSVASPGSGGLDARARTPLPLPDGSYVKVWFRGDDICRVDIKSA